MEKVYKGVNGQITIVNNLLVITRKGALGFLTQGLQGEKRIPMKNITAVQFKSAGFFTNGYIQLSTLGAVEQSKGIFSATQNENTVMFGKNMNGEFLELRNKIEDIISK